MLPSDPRQLVLDANDSAGTAALALVSSLIGHLFKLGKLEPEEADGIAALAAFSCRKAGDEAAGALIEASFPNCKNVDLTAYAVENDIEIEMVTKQ